MCLLRQPLPACAVWVPSDGYFVQPSMQPVAVSTQHHPSAKPVANIQEAAQSTRSNTARCICEALRVQGLGLGAHPQVPALAEVQGAQRGHAGPGDVRMHLQVARAGHVQAPQLAQRADLGGEVAQPARAHSQQPQLRQLEQSLQAACIMRNAPAAIDADLTARSARSRVLPAAIGASAATEPVRHSPSDRARNTLSQESWFPWGYESESKEGQQLQSAGCRSVACAACRCE